MITLAKKDYAQPISTTKQSQEVKIPVRQLTLREAILLALRYNPDIQNAELDRIIQRYQLKLAHNAFELNYALAGSGTWQNNHFTGIGTSQNKTLLITPEARLKTKAGTQWSLNLNNNGGILTPYNPVLNATVTQPLLRGFGKAVNEAPLQDAIDAEFLNKVTLRQSVIDQITAVIEAYRALIVSANNLKNQRRQQTEAKQLFEINQKRIDAGQLEPTANIQQSYQIESLNLMVEQAENEFNNSSQNLLQTIGLDPATRIQVPSNVVIGKIQIPNRQEAIEMALTHNSQYIGQMMQYKADKRAYLVAKNEQLWQLDLNASAQTGSVSTVDNPQGFRDMYNGHNVSESVNLTLSIPIHDISRRSQLVNAKVALEKDRIQQIALKRALITSITNSINTIQSQAKQYQLAKRQLALAKQSYDLEKKKQDAGISSALEVNQTQNQLIQAQSGLISAKIAYLNEVSALQRLLGTTLLAWHIQLRQPL